MAITASQVNELRQKTGAGMMDCKKALTESDGDFEKAIEILRKKGASVASKRAEKSANEGMVITKLSDAVSYTHLRAHETVLDLVCRLLLEKKKIYKKKKNL